MHRECLHTLRAKAVSVPGTHLIAFMCFRAASASPASRPLAAAPAAADCSCAAAASLSRNCCPRADTCRVQWEARRTQVAVGTAARKSQVCSQVQQPASCPTPAARPQLRVRGFNSAVLQWQPHGVPAEEVVPEKPVAKCIPSVRSHPGAI